MATTKASATVPKQPPGRFDPDPPPDLPDGPEPDHPEPDPDAPLSPQSGG
jgi:hypothetical protein